MMQLARRISLLVALSLLTSAATAHAECAWIVWLEGLNPPTGTPVHDVWSPNKFTRHGRAL